MNRIYLIHTILSIITFCFLINSDCKSQKIYAGLPIIKNFSPKEYKGGIQNWKILQDKRGIVYIANNLGVLEFDGSEWRLHKITNGTKVRSLLVGSKGQVYIAAQKDFGYFFPDGKGEYKFMSLADSLPPQYRNFDETWGIFQSGEEEIYFCTFKYIFYYNKGEIEIIDPKASLEFSFFINDKLYVFKWGQGLMELKNNKLVLVEKGEYFKNINISSIIPYDKNHLLITTVSNGIFLYDGYNVYAWRIALPKGMSDLMINNAIRLRNGNFAIGTQSDGLMIVTPQGKVVTHLSKGRGLNSRTILSLYQDDLDNLWVGMNNGIAYVELGSPFTLINEQNELPGTGYTAFLHKEKLYLGTNNGLYFKQYADDDKTDNFKNFELHKNTSGQVYNVSLVGGEVLMGHHNGAFRLNNNFAEEISPHPGGWKFLSLIENQDVMIEGTYGGLLLYKKANNKWKFIKYLEGLNESSRVMEQDYDGNIWMTHGYKGVFKIQLNDKNDEIEEVKFYNSKNGFPTDLLINVHKIKNQILFTAERGIFRYDKEKDHFVPHNEFEKYFDKDIHIRALEEDLSGNIYYLAGNKLGVLRKTEFGEYENEINLFNKVNDLLNDDLENISVLNHHNVLIGAKEGFIHYSPMNFRNYSKSFNVYIRKVAIISDSDSVLFAGNFTKDGTLIKHQPLISQYNLPYSNNSLRFSFAATFYDGLSDLKYQYKLENFDDKWLEWTHKTEKEYTNIPEGHYTFKVRAKNIYGVISEEANYTFLILPPWYRSSIAYFMYVSTLVSFFVLGIKINSKKHKKEKQLVIYQKDKELKEKDSEFERAAKKSEETIDKLKNEKLETEIRYKNKELATSTMNIINKNEFISHIKNTLNSIIKGNTSKVVSEELKKITKDIDKNLASDNDWKQFEFHFDRVHGSFSNRMHEKYPNLSPQERKLCAYLRMNMSTKEIAHLMNISVRGVEISRYRLRKKLGIEREINLTEFILNF